MRGENNVSLMLAERNHISTLGGGEKKKIGREQAGCGVGLGGGAFQGGGGGGGAGCGFLRSYDHSASFTRG